VKTELCEKPASFSLYYQTANTANTELCEMLASLSEIGIAIAEHGMVIV
jgi:hypothetical protein